MDWFPVVAKNAQTPYDPGPYLKSALARSATGAGTTARSVITGHARRRRRRPDLEHRPELADDRHLIPGILQALAALWLARAVTYRPR